MTANGYRLIRASGQTSDAARALLASMIDEAGLCKCCGALVLLDGRIDWSGHQPTLPCGQLVAALTTLGPAVKAVTS
jgi:hypothetical protein